MSEIRNHFDNMERIDVTTKPLPPQRWICKLRAVDETGQASWYGTGFKINFIPRSNCKLIVTAGHNLFRNGKYAERIYVSFPGEETVSVFGSDFFTSHDKLREGCDIADYGLIILPGDSNDGFGWGCLIDDAELKDRQITVCGYSDDESEISQWTATGEISRTSADKIFYTSNATESQSGSPVYSWHRETWMAFGVHTKGGNPNSATRFNLQIMRKLLSWRAPIRFSIQSNQFPKAYLRACKGNFPVPNIYTGIGFGIVNCQYFDSPPHTGSSIPWELFDIIPTFIPSSIHPIDESQVVVAIGSAAFENLFIRMNGGWAGLTLGLSGMGKVNCQYGVGEWELFRIVYLSGGLIAIKSVAFPNAYLRIQAKVSLISGLGGGYGKVNCQRYEEGQMPHGYEVFRLHAA